MAHLTLTVNRKQHCTPSISPSLYPLPTGVHTVHSCTYGPHKSLCLCVRVLVLCYEKDQKDSIQHDECLNLFFVVRISKMFLFILCKWLRNVPISFLTELKGQKLQNTLCPALIICKYIAVCAAAVERQMVSLPKSLQLCDTVQGDIALWCGVPSSSLALFSCERCLIVYIPVPSFAEQHKPMPAKPTVYSCSGTLRFPNPQICL